MARRGASCSGLSGCPVAGKTKVNTREIGRILKSKGARDACMPTAIRTLAEAVVSAPVDTGDYARSLRIAYGTTDRVVVRVGSDDPFAPLVQAKHGHLRKALRKAAR